jgi:hypothetical protein
MITKFTIPGATATASAACAAKPRRSMTLYAPSTNTVPVYYALGDADATIPTGAKPGLPLAAGATVTILPVDRADLLNEVVYAVHGDAGNQTLVIHERAI